MRYNLIYKHKDSPEQHKVVCDGFVIDKVGVYAHIDDAPDLFVPISSLDYFRIGLNKEKEKTGV